MASYRLDILIRGRDRASGPLARIGLSLQRILQIASGILIAGVFRALANGIRELAGATVESYVALERTTIALETLIARETSRGEIVETVYTNFRRYNGLEILEYDKKRAALMELQGALEGYIEDMQEAYDEEGDQSLAFLQASISIRETKLAMEELRGELSEFEQAGGITSSWVETTIVGAKSLSDAILEATGPAKQLLDWVVRLALVSPFREQDVMRVLQITAGYGYLTQAYGDNISEAERLKLAQAGGEVTAQRLTLAILNLSAALGLPSEGITRIAAAFGQILAAGKLTGEEIRQLRNAGVGIDLLARSMGMTVAEFQALQDQGLILAEDLMPALVELIEDELGGASSRLAMTFGGLIENLREFRDVALRTFFGPTFKAITPYLQNLFDSITTEESLRKIEMWGERFRDVLFNVIELGREAAATWDRISANPFELADMAVDVSIDILGEDVTQRLQDAVVSLSNINIELGFMDGNAAAAEGAVGGIATYFGATGALSLGKGILKAIGGLILFVGGKLGWLGVIAGILGAAWNGNWLGMRDLVIDVWENDLKPFLQETATQLGVDIPAAIAEAKRWWVEELVPALEEGVKTLREDVIPAIFEWAGATRDELITELENLKEQVNRDVVPSFTRFWLFAKLAKVGAIGLRDYLRDELYPGFIEHVMVPISNFVIPPFLTFKKILIMDVVPAIKETVGQLQGPLSMTLSSVGIIYQTWMQPALENMMTGFVLLGTVYLPLFVEWLGIKFEEAGKRFKTVWEGTIGPTLESGVELFTEGIIPLYIEWWTLLATIGNIGLRLVAGAYNEWMKPALEDFTHWVGEQLNPVLEWWHFWLSLIATILVGGLQYTAHLWIDVILPNWKLAFEGVADALSKVADWLDRLNEKLANLTLPDWAIGDSPPPAAFYFWDIAQAVNDATTEMERMDLRLGSLNRRNIAINGRASDTMGSASTMATGAQTIVQNNTFNVPDKATAKLVAHLLRDQKVGRYDTYMGRASAYG